MLYFFFYEGWEDLILLFAFDSTLLFKKGTSAWWIFFTLIVEEGQKVNNLQENKKEKVTISGTERFGLLEQNVVRILEDLPEA